MIPTKALNLSGTIGICGLLIIMFLILDMPAQAQSCRCYHRHPHVRHSARRTRTHYVTRYRTVYRNVYVPTTTRSMPPNAANNEYVDNTNPRVVVTDPDYTKNSNYVGGNYTDMSRIARGWGRRDGWKDGYKAALKRHAYNIEDNTDYREANNGYKRRFGSKHLYQSDYRDGYAKGYESGFRAVAGGSYVAGK